jgi:hypothetical protein
MRAARRGYRIGELCTEISAAIPGIDPSRTRPGGPVRWTTLAGVSASRLVTIVGAAALIAAGWWHAVPEY